MININEVRGHVNANNKLLAALDLNPDLTVSYLSDESFLIQNHDNKVICMITFTKDDIIRMWEFSKLIKDPGFCELIKNHSTRSR